jgi:hypothetical protein
MPPKADPYATTAQKTIDFLLLVFTILVIAFVFLTAKQKRSTSGAPESVRASQTQQQLVAK